ncbi:glycosyltransferase family 4 protein [Nodosilinea sp. LEGE 07088]|uniref:glycosyltransferase family 4 protein n=1 Tax=Nodosilinea sp. LEGE 07088 TaxID=2777968 RepID=UPI001882FFBE|nr:glycosyltransferase family 4 protein [Nodosilinea sp. LEGE 07088]MBE9140733.1 glycosyltransferase family 4 protein [Nodosilinea sp. LEGE 07088]
MSSEALPTAVAVVHEWLVSRAGSEKVVEQLLKVCPQADLFSLVEFLEPEAASLIPPGTRLQTSFIQNLPWAQRHFRQYLPLMPLAIEQFDLSAYDLVISSNHAVAKGVLTRPHQLHISYVHTPIRYAWDLQQQYLQQAGLTSGVKSALTRLILHYLRLWDLAAAHRVDCFVANSRYVARRIWKTYRRPATVIYPPVAIDRFRWQQPRADFFLTVSRCVPYKRVDLTVAAFNQLGLPLVVIGDGPALASLQQQARPNITFLRNPTDAVVSDYMERCRGFIFPAEEDFGITVVEAQAAGAPVIAYGRGGCAETVVDGKTGVLFKHQTVDDIVQAVTHFNQHRAEFDPETIRCQAETFSEPRFSQELNHYLAQKWLKFQQGDELE